MSFVLRREAKLSEPGSAPESPKLWRPGGMESSNPQKPASPPKPAFPPKPEPPPRTKEDLFKFYETMGNVTGPDLSLKDIVERTKKPIRKANLKTLRERVDHEEEGGTQQHQHRHELLDGNPKVVVPPKADGEKIRHGRGPKPFRKPFRDYFENHEQPRRNDAADSSHEAVRLRTQAVASPRRSFHEATSTHEAVRLTPAASPRRTFHEAMSTPEASPLRSKSVGSSSRMPPASPTRSSRPVLESSDPNTWLNPNYTTALRSPLRSPGLPSKVSPNPRVSPLASASFPSQVHRPSFGDPEPVRRRRETPSEWKASTEHWMPSPSSPRRSNYVGASPLGEAPRSSTGDDRPNWHKQQALGDLFKAKPTAGPPPFRKAHPSNHCSTCSSFTLFKTRCLVCGNVYCRDCVKDAMGDMPEGRKCRQTCLGRPFHSRYMRKAGNGWFCFVPSAASAAELKWARRRYPHESVSKASANRNSAQFSNATTPRSGHSTTPTSTTHMMSNRSHAHRNPHSRTRVS